MKVTLFHKILISTDLENQMEGKFRPSDTFNGKQANRGYLRLLPNKCLFWEKRFPTIADRKKKMVEKKK